MRKDFRVPYTLYFTQEEKERIKSLVRKKGITMAQYIRNLIHRDLEREKTK